MFKRFCIRMEKACAFLLIVLAGVAICKYELSLLIVYFTFLAVVVALFKERILGYFFEPILEISLADSPLNFAIVPAIDKMGQIADYHASIGIIVENFGSGKAENVILYFDGLKSNAIQQFVRYKTLPLVRSWVGDVTLKFLSKNQPIRFDIGYLSQREPSFFNFKFYSTPSALRRIDCTKINNSFFKFKIKAFADNAPEAAEAVLKIKYDGRYPQGLKVKML